VRLAWRLAPPAPPALMTISQPRGQVNYWASAIAHINAD
jgi:hypothetical protein